MFRVGILRMVASTSTDTQPAIDARQTCHDPHGPSQGAAFTHDTKLDHQRFTYRNEVYGTDWYRAARYDAPWDGQRERASMQVASPLIKKCRVTHKATNTDIFFFFFLSLYSFSFLSLVHTQRRWTAAAPSSRYSARGTKLFSTNCGRLASRDPPIQAAWCRSGDGIAVT